jgi:dipeptidase E
MGKIIAIGGGEIGRPGYPVETTEIDKEIIRLSGRKRPKLLFIPTATDDSEIYIETVFKHFAKDLGCIVDVLCLVKEKPNIEEIHRKIFNSNIVYVGGGNTGRMLRIWRRYGLDKILTEVYRKDVVLSGLSAGAICWFRWGSSDSRRFTNPTAGLIRIRGMNFISALFCPHYNSEEDRKPYLKELMKKTPGVAIAVDNCCAIEFVDNNYRIITSKIDANAYKVYWKKGEFHEEIIEQIKEFVPIDNLLRK